MKKFLSQMIYPVMMVLLLVGIALWLRKNHPRAARVVGVGALLLFLFFSYDLSGILLVKPLEQRYPAVTASECSSAKYVVSLGGGSCSDSSLPALAQLSRQSALRLTTGVILLRQLPEASLIVTGGAVFDPVPIAHLSRQAAIDLGVDSLRIIMADSALTTEMEAVAVKKIVGTNTVALVTSALHMPRAVALFEKVGVRVIPVPCDYQYREGVFTPSTLFPSAPRMAHAHEAVHEYFGMFWAMLRKKV